MSTISPLEFIRGPGERLQPVEHRRFEPQGEDVEPQLHRGRDLVDVLPARAGGGDEALLGQRQRAGEEVSSLIGIGKAEACEIGRETAPWRRSAACLRAASVSCAAWSIVRFMRGSSVP